MFRKILLASASLAAFGFHPASVGAQNFSESYKFLKAVKERDGSEVTGILSGSGARLVNTKEYSTGDAALHIVTRERDLDWLRFMLGKGARADLANNKGETPLVLATQLGWIDGVNALLRSGAKVDGTNGRGETPLILAVQNRDIAMIRLLLASGADPKRGDRVAGYSAMDYAKRDDRSGNILRLLEQEAKPAKAAAGPPR